MQTYVITLRIASNIIDELMMSSEPQAGIEPALQHSNCWVREDHRLGHKYGMLVKVFIDLTTDKNLLESCKDDGRIYGLFQIYDAFGDEKYIGMIAKHIWNRSSYPNLMSEACGEEIFSFHYCSDWIFEFQTDETNAALFKLLSPNPPSVKIIYPKKISPEELIFKV